MAPHGSPVDISGDKREIRPWGLWTQIPSSFGPCRSSMNEIGREEKERRRRRGEVGRRGEGGGRMRGEKVGY